jgi:hypothetical protein
MQQLTPFTLPSVAATAGGTTPVLSQQKCWVWSTTALKPLWYDGTYHDFRTALEFSASTVYASGDQAMFAGYEVQANAAFPAGAFTWGTTGATWSPILQGQTWMGVYAAGTAYTAGQVVAASTTGNVLYVAMAATTGNAVTTGYWQPLGVHAANPMVAASSTVAGISGEVPQPQIGDQNKLLSGGGFWRTSGYLAITTWATIFASPTTGFVRGDKVLVTDIGSSGTEMIWDGSAWRFNGSAIIARITASVNVTATTETLIMGVTIPAGLAISGSSFDFVLYGAQTNTAAATTSTYRIRIDTTASALTGNQPASTLVTNGTTARAAQNVQVEGNMVLTSATAAIGSMYQTQDINNNPRPTGGPTSVAIAPTAVWYLDLSVQNSATTTTRTFSGGYISMVR